MLFATYSIIILNTRVVNVYVAATPKEAWASGPHADRPLASGGISTLQSPDKISVKCNSPKSVSRQSQSTLLLYLKFCRRRAVDNPVAGGL